MSAIIVEQSPRLILPITQRAIVLDRGSVVHEGSSADLLTDRREAGSMACGDEAIGPARSFER